MIILGISMGEISSACLIQDGKLLGASYEERFHRKKSWSGFPSKTIKYLLKSNNLKANDIDKIGIVNEQTSSLEYSLVQRHHSFNVKDYIKEAYDYYYPVLYKKKSLNYIKIFKDKIVNNIYPSKIQFQIEKFGENNKNSRDLRQQIVKEVLKIKNIKCQFIEHHFCHALYGLLFLPTKQINALIFTADSFGDYSNSNVYETSDGNIKNIFSSSSQNLGRLYRNITLLLGMKPYQHEYKVMGLAPYANTIYAKKVKKIFEQYLYGFNKDWLFRKKPKDNYFEFKSQLEGIRFDNIAGGLQLYLEERLLEWFEYFLKKDKKHDSVIFSGGLSMNVKANLKIEQLCKKYNKKFYCAPSGDDYSNAISAGYATYLDIKRQSYLSDLSKFRLKSLNHGYHFSMTDREKIISWALKNNCNVEKVNFKKAANYLRNGKIFALCHGKAEFGARALGYRSIIADPSNFETIKKINKAIKMRDFWMPFAPAILKGYEKKYSKMIDWKNHRFMASSVETTPEGEKKLAASAHPYDQTIRPMIVEKETNAFFYNLINQFGIKSGTYALLNTSLNLHGYPIVNNAEDLIFVMEKSSLDGIITEDSLITYK